MKTKFIAGFILLLGLSFFLVKLLPKGQDVIFVASYSSRTSFFPSRYLVHLDSDQRESASFLYPHGNPMAWSVDGSWVASVERFTEQDRCCNLDIVFYDLQSSRTERMILPASQENNPAWAPDGKRVVYTTNTVQGSAETERLILADVSCLADKNPCNFSVTELELGTDPDWSPVSDELLFVRNGRVFVLRSREDSPEEINLGLENCRSPKWHPQGKLFVIACGGDIYLASFDGKDPVNLTEGSGNNFQPSWTQDGLNVLFLSTRNEMMGSRTGDSGNLELNALFIIDIATRHQKQLTSSDDHIFWYSWVANSPGLQTRLFWP